MGNVGIRLNQNATHVTLAKENFGTKDEAETEMIDPESRITFRSAALQNLCTNTDYLENVFWRWPSSGPGLNNLSEGASPNCTGFKEVLLHAHENAEEQNKVFL